MFGSIILAGGRALRLGRDKLQEEVGGRPVLQRVVDTLKLLSDDIIIVINQTPSLPGGYNGSAIKVVSDIFPAGGPLGGLYSGLAASSASHNMVVAGDMPFLNLSLLRYMLDITGAGGSNREAAFDVVIPRINGFIEPLHAVYSRRCLPYVKQEVESGRCNIRSFFPKVKVKYIENAEIDLFDRQHLSFFNINDEEDLTKAREIAKKID